MSSKLYVGNKNKSIILFLYTSHKISYIFGYALSSKIYLITKEMEFDILFNGRDVFEGIKM